jgi:signal transduction histidine kinase
MWYRVVNRTKRKLEIEQIRNHIAQDLHDDIGSTLSSIKIISKMGAQNSTHERENGNFLQIENYSGKMLSTMSDIIWSINPQNDTLGMIVLHMKEFAAEILEPKNIGFQFTGTGNLEDLKIEVVARKNLFLIYKEAINNAAKYSHCTEIRIHLIVLSEQLTLHIHDNGEGFDVQKVKPGNGLKNMKERAALMKGQFEITTEEGNGTQITVSTPIA